MYKLLIFATFATSITAAVAAPEEARTTRAGVNNDPSQIVCRNERQIGTRLGSTRVCRTRAEWEEYRRNTRRSVEKAQQGMQTGYGD